MPITEASGSDLLEIQKLKEKNTKEQEFEMKFFMS
jgi:hypothetical protein